MTSLDSSVQDAHLYVDDEVLFLRPWEIHFVQNYAWQIGLAVHQAGWVEFKQDLATNSQCVALGFRYKGKPVLLGTAVVTRPTPRETRCSIREIDGAAPPPGPQHYACISEALTNTWRYFEFMARETSEQLSWPWWRKLF